MGLLKPQKGEIRLLPEGKLVLFWIVGAIAIVFGAWIAGHVENTLGTTTGSYVLAIIISLLLYYNSIWNRYRKRWIFA